MQKINYLAQKIIVLQQQYLEQLGYVGHVHFELEGCFEFENNHNAQVDFTAINKLIQQYNIAGEFVHEYWRNQWEFVSAFNGQSPLTEAMNLDKIINYLPQLIKQTYDSNITTLIKPVVWSGDQGQLADDCQNIFMAKKRAVHIPNAVQINVSASALYGEHTNNNLIADTLLGEYLQQTFLQTSLACSLLFLPEEEAFERLLLKTKYGLTQELCSPTDISGGHQGSIALYREKGKHNQKLGEETLVYDHQHNALLSEYNWQKTARVEHRLGASSRHYNAYVNVVFALANLIAAIEKYHNNDELINFTSQTLSLSLYSDKSQLGAIDLFQQEHWFSNAINGLVDKIALSAKQKLDLTHAEHWGSELKALILARYQHTIINKD